MSRAISSFFTFVLLFTGIVSAQQQELWPKWKKAEVDRVLNNSAWAQTQVETDTSEMTYSPTAAGRSSVGASNARTSSGSISNQQSVNNNRADRGATNQPIAVNYHIRFLSAKPIRQAVARMIEIRDRDSAKVIDQMKPFVERDFSQFIVIAVTFDSTDGRFSGPALQAFSSATLATLKNSAYLERNDGRRLFLIDYKVPIADGLGAKFIFPRIVDERPFLTSTSTVRFFAQLSDSIKLSMNFKLSDMRYEGKLEY